MEGVSENTMICRECGARIEDDAISCKFCGAQYGEPVAESAVEEPIAEQEEVQNIVSEQDEIDAILDANEAKRRAQMERLSAEKQAQLKEKEKRRKDKKTRQRRNRALIILLVLLCGGAIAAGVYYISPSYNGDSDDSVVLVTQKPTETPIATEKPEETERPEPTIGIVEEDEAIVPSDEVIATKAPVVATNKPVVTKKPVATQPKPAATKKPVVQINSNSIKSALVTGGEVIKADGNSYMSFTYNGKVCYAKVSDNTTNNFIAGKPMTLSAKDSGAKYNGNVVYTITDITHYNGTYLLANSGTQLVTEADLQGKTAQELRLARNEIYARHGRNFKDAELQNYFNSCAWYKPNSKYNYANDSANLNSIEKKNISIIKKYEDSVK